MPLGNWNLEWLDHNSQRRYPLADSASGQDVSATFTLPVDFLVELDLPVHAGLDVDPSRFFIWQLGVYATGFTVLVGYQPAVGDPVKVATAMIPRDSFAPNTPYALGGIGDYADTVGKLVIGRFVGIDQQPAGLFSFDLASAQIETDCIRPLIRGVSALLIASGAEISERLYGDIELVAEENMQITPVIVEGEDPQIRFSAIEGEGLADPCVCEGNEEGPPIRRINGIPATPTGDFTLLGGACLEWQGITNGLRAVDLCSEPCCGCRDLEAVTRDLESFGSKATTLENFINRLESAVTQMNQVVLGSRLNDRGCVDCGT